MGKLRVVDVVEDQSGALAIGITEEDLSFSFRISLGDLVVVPVPRSEPGTQHICFDARRLLDMGFAPEDLFDVQLAYDGNLTRVAAAKGGMLASDYIRAQMALKSHARVAKSVGLNLSRDSLFKMMPAGQLENIFRLRGQLIMALRDEAVAVEGRGPEVEEKTKLLSVIRRIETAGVCVDVARAVDALRSSDPLEPHEAEFFRKVSQGSKGGMVYTRYSPVGVKTGRLRVEKGFNTMGIPHGKCRDAVISRHENGWIYAFDFNAIDYRCIVDSIEDETFRETYAETDDFHDCTRQMIGCTEVPRNVIKAITYVHIYGGSEETVAKNVNLSLYEVKRILERMDQELWSIKEFRETLYQEAQANGYVVLPMGRRVRVAKDDHPGKVLGLYAQSYSSWVFERALAAVDYVIQTKHLKSRIIFPVHDEIVMDIPNEEHVHDVDFRGAMEWAGDTPFKVKTKRGRTYGDATDRS